MSKLRLHTLPTDEKTLRAPNQPLSFPFSKDVLKLIEEMKAAVRQFKGIGLAAPQIGHNLTLAVINLDHLGITPFAIANPKVVSKSIKKTIMEEGCLSIPGKYGGVKRPAKIEVEFHREDGKKVIMKASDLLAKVFQHEIDHLNSVLIIDRFEKS